MSLSIEKLFNARREKFQIITDGREWMHTALAFDAQQHVTIELLVPVIAF
jgi:hypothetical protein